MRGEWQIWGGDRWFFAKQCHLIIEHSNIFCFLTPSSSLKLTQTFSICFSGREVEGWKSDVHLKVSWNKKLCFNKAKDYAFVAGLKANLRKGKESLVSLDISFDKRRGVILGTFLVNPFRLVDKEKCEALWWFSFTFKSLDSKKHYYGFSGPASQLLK